MSREGGVGTMMTRHEKVRLTPMSQLPGLSNHPGVSTAIPEQRPLFTKSIRGQGITSSQVGRENRYFQPRSIERIQKVHCREIIPISPKTENDTSRITNVEIPPLTIELFKIPEYQLSRDQKRILIEIGKRHKEVNDEFLALFEKRYVVFIEDGTDLADELGSSKPRDDLDSVTINPKVSRNMVDQSLENSLITQGTKKSQNRNQINASKFMSSQKNFTSGSLLSPLGNMPTQALVPVIKKQWNKRQKRIRIDVNKFRAKYDFDVALRVCPMRSGIDYNDSF